MISAITNAINNPTSFFLQFFYEEPLMVESVVSESAEDRTFLRMHRAPLKNLKFMSCFLYCICPH